MDRIKRLTLLRICAQDKNIEHVGDCVKAGSVQVGEAVY